MIRVCYCYLIVCYLALRFFCFFVDSFLFFDPGLASLSHAIVSSFSSSRGQSLQHTLKSVVTRCSLQFSHRSL